MFRFTGPLLSELNQSGVWPCTGRPGQPCHHHGERYPASLDDMVGVRINGNDHYMVDSVIWQYTVLGVQVNGAAMLLAGVHAWGCGAPWCAGGSTGLTGIQVNTHQTRLVGCYLDFNFLDIFDPIRGIVVQNTFFLGTSARLIARNHSAGAHGVLDGLTMEGNLLLNVELQGNFSSPTARAQIESDNIGVEQQSGPPHWYPLGSRLGQRLTTVRRRQRSCIGTPPCAGAQSRFQFNLSDPGEHLERDILLLPTVDMMQYSVLLSGSFPQEEPTPTHTAVMDSSNGTETAVITVVFNKPVLATVFLTAQCCTGHSAGTEAGW